MKALLCTALLGICVAVTMAQRTTEIYGHIKYKSNSAPAKGVVVSIGNYSVVTDANGYYKVGFVKAGNNTVYLSPPGKRTRSVTVKIGVGSNLKDFTIDW